MSEQTYQRLWDGACHRIHDWVTVGDAIRTGERDNWLTVSGFHEHYSRKAHQPDYFETVELAGNGTHYHLLCWDEDGDIGPMLYKEADWEEQEHDLLNDYAYPRGGERVETIEIGVRYSYSPLSDTYYWVDEWEERGEGRIIAKTKTEIEPDEVPDGWMELLTADSD